MKTISIKINKPCQENWSNMTEEEKGRFCKVCSKTVIDFTQLSQEEIIEKLKSSKGETCGRVTKYQLDTPFVKFEKVKPRNITFSKFAASVLLATSIATSPSCNLPDANPPIPTEQTSHQPNLNIEKTKKPKKQEPKTPNPKPSGPTVFKGKIVSEETGKPIENAKLTFVTLSELYSTFTSKTGEFELKIPSELIDNDNVIRVTFDEIVKEVEKKEDENDLFTFSLDQYYEQADLVLSKNEIKNHYYFKAKLDLQIHYLGGVGLHVEKLKDPIVIDNGEQIDYHEFMKAQYGEKSSCNLTNKNQMYFPSESAIALYGEEAEAGLYLITNLK